MKKKIVSVLLSVALLCASVPLSAVQVFALDLPTATGFDNAEQIELDEVKTIKLDDPGKTALLKFTAPADDEYVFLDTKNYVSTTVYNSDFKITERGGSQTRVNLKSGETVYFDCGFDDGFYASSFDVKVIVSPKATGMKFLFSDSVKELNEHIGLKSSLSVQFIPSYAKIENVTYSSENPNVVKIDKWGRYECLSQGSTVLTAVSESGLKCSIPVNVNMYETISPGDTKTVAINDSDNTKIFMITPDKSGTYTFKSNSEKRVTAFLYDEKYEINAFDDCSGYINGDGINYNISYYLEAGKTYFLDTCLWIGSGTFEVTAEYDSLYISDLKVLSAPDISTYYYGEYDRFPNCEGLSLRTTWSDGEVVDCTYDGQSESIRGFKINLKYRSDIYDSNYSYDNNIYLTVFCAGKTVHTMLSNSSYPNAIACGLTGSCAWTLDQNGTLIIDGNGWMMSYENDYIGPPWSSYKKDIKSVMIQSGVTYVGECAFSGCTELTDVTIPESVTSIGDQAFKGCADGFTVYGYSDTYAEEYAEKNGFIFKEIGSKSSNATGDVNGDNVVDILDASMIQKYTVEKVTLTDEQKEAADVNDDGVCDILDATDIQKFTVEKIPGFN